MQIFRLTKINSFKVFQKVKKIFMASTALFIAKDVFTSIVSVRCHTKVFCEKVFLKISNNSQKNTCARVLVLIKVQASVSEIFNKVISVQVFSYEFGEIFKNNYFVEHLQMDNSLASWK